MNLKNALLKLAHENSDLRKDLVPLLRVADYRDEHAEKEGKEISRRVLQQSALSKFLTGIPMMYGGWDPEKAASHGTGIAPLIVKESFLWAVPEERFLKVFGVSPPPGNLFARRFRGDLFFKSKTHILEPLSLLASPARIGKHPPGTLLVYLVLRHKIYDEHYLEKGYYTSHPMEYER